MHLLNLSSIMALNYFFHLIFQSIRQISKHSLKQSNVLNIKNWVLLLYVSLFLHAYDLSYTHTPPNTQWITNKDLLYSIGKYIQYIVITSKRKESGREHIYIYIYIYGYHYEVKWSVPQSCPTLCDPIDYSLPGSSVHGILQARILEGVAVPFSSRSSQPRDQTLQFQFFITGATREAHT